MITFLGWIGLCYGLFNLALPQIIEAKGLKPHGWSFDLAYHVANEAVFFISAVTLLVAKRLAALDKRLRTLEGEKDK
jgi:hypothetical protein